MRGAERCWVSAKDAALHGLDWAECDRKGIRFGNAYNCPSKSWVCLQRPLETNGFFEAVASESLTEMRTSIAISSGFEALEDSWTAATTKPAWLNYRLPENVACWGKKRGGAVAIMPCLWASQKHRTILSWQQYADWEGTLDWIWQCCSCLIIIIYIWTVSFAWMNVKKMNRDSCDAILLVEFQGTAVLINCTGEAQSFGCCRHYGVEFVLVMDMLYVPWNWHFQEFHVPCQVLDVILVYYTPEVCARQPPPKSCFYSGYIF